MSLRYYLIISLFLWNSAQLNALTISAQEAREIGLKIWHNECKGTIEGLTSWNEGEDFASVGIGHFIWYPAGKVGIYKDTFPELLVFLKKHKKNIPAGIVKGKSMTCPWNSRQEFMKALATKPMKDLRKFLEETIDLQIKFLINRLTTAFPRIINGLAKKQQIHVKNQFNRVAQTPRGLYALIDYINFKGEGTVCHEQYNGHGWGLLQVLQGMSGTNPGLEALKNFAQSAQNVLITRVQNAPKERNEKRWLPGWKNRINTYVA